MAIAERFVAICDVLGFSQLVKSTSLPTLCANYKNLLEPVYDLLSNSAKKAK